jgi:hypothetical protein
MNQKHDAPEGGAEWKLVPVEPTEKMIRAAFRDQPGGDVGFARAYDVMLAAAPTPPAPSGLVDVVRPEDVETAAVALWRLEHPDNDEFSAVAPNDWLRWPETPREASLAYETHSREEYREQVRVVLASIGNAVAGPDYDAYDAGYQYGKQVGSSQEKHGRSLRALPMPDPQLLVRQYSNNPSSLDAILSGQPSTPPAPVALVDAVRDAAEGLLKDTSWMLDKAGGIVSSSRLLALRSALDATLSGQQGGAVPAGDLRPGLEEANRLLTAAVASAYADTVKFDTARNYGAHAQAQRDCQTIRYALERARLAEQFAPAGACADGVEGLREAAQDVAHRAVKDGMVKHWAAEMVALRAALDAGSSKEGRS